MTKRIVFALIVACLLLTASAIASSWQYGLASETWPLIDELYWWSHPPGPQLGIIRYSSAVFEVVEEPGRFVFYCYSADAAVPNFVGAQMIVTTRRLDSTWRDWLTPEGLDSQGSLGLDLIASLGSIATWIEVRRSRDDEYGAIPRWYQGCGSSAFREWPASALEFSNGTLIIGLPSTTQVEFSVNVHLWIPHGCDSWNDGGIEREGTVMVRCWLE